MGLSLNPTKCHTVMGPGDSLEFMGRVYGFEAAAPLADRFLASTPPRIATLMASRISKYDKLSLLRQCLLAEVNYGPFIDIDEAEPKYLELDELFINEVQTLVGSTRETARQLVLAPREMGGLGWLLPGALFPSCREQAQAVEAGTVSVLRELRRNAQRNLAEGPNPFLQLNQRLLTPIGTFALGGKVRLTDEQFEMATDHLRPADPLLHPDMQPSCPFCRRKEGPNHESSCPATQAERSARHSRLVAALHRMFPDLFRNKPEHRDADTGLCPDLLTRDNIAIDYKVTCDSYAAREYNGKVTHCEEKYDKDKVMPIVFGDRITIVPASLNNLAGLCKPPALTKVLTIAATILLQSWRYCRKVSRDAACAFADAVLESAAPE